jgi:hypothetical protein
MNADFDRRTGQAPAAIAKISANFFVEIKSARKFWPPPDGDLVPASGIEPLTSGL